MQEHYLLFAWLLGQLPLDTLVLPVVFDDMREEGVRTSLAAALKDPGTTRILGLTPIGQRLVANHGEQGAAGNDMAALADTVQDRSERFLNAELERIWPLWVRRPALRGAEELDFMHFQAGGHRLLAAALYQVLVCLWGAEGGSDRPSAIRWMSIGG